ncbi:MAG: hypothetical protein GY733_08140, partial [bacterium]|nr:hypothetical protein [bacterium]
FCAALGRALPHLREPEVLERFKFVVGVMVHVIAGHYEIEIEPGSSLVRSAEQRVQAIVSFLAAGLRSPAFVAIPMGKD